MIDWLISWFNTENLSHTVDILSVIGFVITLIGFPISVISLVITLYVYQSIENIKGQYVSKARVPDLLKNLNKHASKLSEYYGDFDNSKDAILLEIGNTEVALDFLKGKVSKQIQTSIEKAYVQISNYKANPERDKLYAVYVDLQKVNQGTFYLQQDQKWEIQ